MRYYLDGGEAEIYRLPQARPPAITPGSFMVCPFALMQSWTPAQLYFQSSIYQIAFDQARVAVQPTLLERDLLGVWN